MKGKRKRLTLHGLGANHPANQPTLKYIKGQEPYYIYNECLAMASILTLEALETGPIPRSSSWAGRPPLARRRGLPRVGALGPVGMRKMD